MTLLYEVGLLFLAGFIAGAINSVAGGGKLLVLPALTASGLSPLTASITANLVLGPGAAVAVHQYRRELRLIPHAYWWLLVPCYGGALAGIVFLQETSQEKFDALVPWLMLTGVAFFVLQPYLKKYFEKPESKRPHESLVIIGPVLLVASVYGGYFGAGFGFLLMGILGFSRLKTIYQLSAFKNIVGGGMEVLGIVWFTVAGGIAWWTGLIAMAGCITGSFFGARFAQKIPQKAVRWFIVTVGFIFTVVVFIQSYHN
jgi:hypothetical protein